ncbi:flagellar basal-body MS-ring/collar protein FliF [Occallatibacter riparius]|uniref:Flagellar M-ring protein n=1 Tax=Occallatibacter riparius TaxID=1002689 RepID=A0A9J7BJR2_9BACT|nr:flagellar basal-body MS-ring/collar protein FliF [Occallatibacter riparius]UWZ83140.1 flagellar M-ring protein FliF [Occallatibacter riparius]
MATETQLQKSAPAIPGNVPLGAGLGAIWTRSRIAWAGMQPKQRIWAVISLTLAAAFLGFLSWYALRTDWRVLYADLDSEDARQIVQELTAAQITFEVAETGGIVRVPAAQLDKARLATSAKGGVKSGRMGFELFDKPNWVGSEFDEQVNYQRALEGELEHTVASLADVESARVHLVMAHDSLFREQERPAKASVVLKLRHRSLADGEPESIRNLVASAVDGLTSDRVVLVDAAGHLPLGPKTPDALRLSAEQALEEKLIATLEPVTGTGNVRASVTLDYDPTAAEQTDEVYKPDQTVTLSMQRTEQTSGPQPVAAGVPGTASNAPNSQTLPVYPHESTPPQSAKSESSTYGASKSVRHTSEAPGRVRRMTAAIVVNDRLVQVQSKNKPALWQPRSADEIRNLTALAQAAVGFDQQRGDMLTVQDLAFDDNRSPEPISPVTRALQQAESSPVLIKCVALVIGLLVLVTFGLRPAMRRATVKEDKKVKPEKTPELAAQASSQAVLATPEQALLDPERQRVQELLDQVAGAVKKQPAQSSRLLQSWIHSD